jgi:hypothetical protein
MELTPRQETQRKLWALVYAHASGDDIWPLLLNEFTTDEARTIGYEVPQVLDELFVAAGLDDQAPILGYCQAKLAELGLPGVAPSVPTTTSDDLRRAAEGLINPANRPDEDGEGQRPDKP